MIAAVIERRTPATALIVAAVLVVVVADHLDGWQGPLLLRLLGIAAAIGLIVSARDWLRTSNGKLALGLTAVTAVVGVSLKVSVWTILDGAAAMLPAAVLLVTTSIVRPAFTACRLDHYLASTLTRVPPRLRALGVDTMAIATGLAAGFGSLAMLGSALGSRAEPRHAAANTAMRGLSMSMLLGPSIASVAVIRMTLPPIPWIASIVTALPLLAASFAISAVLTPPIKVRSDGLAGRRLPHLVALPMLASVPVLAFAAAALWQLEATESITFGCLTTGLLLSYLHGSSDTTAILDDQILRGWSRSQAEIALFAASGAVASLLRDPAVAALAHPVAALVPSGTAGVLFLLVVVPAICVVGVHPLPLFALLAPLIPASQLGLNASGLYQIWIVTVGIALLLSPASILTSITKTSFDLSSDQVGLRRNIIYAVLMGAAAAILIPAINPA
jgi:hypothetical protein